MVTEISVNLSFCELFPKPAKGKKEKNPGRKRKHFVLER